MHKCLKIARIGQQVWGKYASRVDKNKSLQSGKLHDPIPSTTMPNLPEAYNRSPTLTWLNSGRCCPQRYIGLTLRLNPTHSLMIDSVVWTSEAARFDFSWKFYAVLYVFVTRHKDLLPCLISVLIKHIEAVLQQQKLVHQYADMQCTRVRSPVRY
jgi:hypothetical protein